MASGSERLEETPSLALRKLVTREILKSQSDVGELQNRTFIEHPILPNTQILGPSFLELPLDFTSCYPILEQSDLVKDRLLYFSKWDKKNFVCWPNYDREWESWTERMFKAKEKELTEVGLSHVITFLQNGILQNPSLIHAALAFWDPSFNCFRFNCGMMAPTVLDVSFLIGLPPHGLFFDIALSTEVPFLAEIEYDGKNASYKRFLRAERKFSDNVSDREMFAYIWYTLCKMIFCHGGKKMVLEFAPLAYVLSKGKTIDLASHFLGYVYKAGFDNHAKPLNQNLGGPLWFLQIWLLAYFPDQKVADRSPLNVYEDMFTILASTPFTLTGYLQYFHQLREDKEEREFVPFQYWGIGPKWISRLMEQRGRSAYHEAWASILLLREIIIGAYVGGCKQAHAEIYCPAQFARQFGLVQAIPCPYPGEINIDLTSRNKINKAQVAILNAEFKSSRTNFQPYLFAITIGPPLPAFSKWWHNSIDLYHESAPVKTFTKDIGTGIEEMTHSDSMSDDGFGRDRGTTSQTSHQEETSKVQSFASVLVAESVQPLRSVPQIMTRSQQQRTTITSPPSGESSWFV
ncbi:hypothetical protein Vadar_000303 [Vaccinium darrowii]|uniref:Uncharacterized protein n=1 Tax=Vaccinium darrowii TaxID=229202 RepID=A0ACB7YAR1_9ERIC|nr:hypothetical protein Vadar_000303 [Vaccinium darrowii]